MSSQPTFLWKAEPFSPSGNSTGDAEDDWIYNDDKPSTLINDVIDPEQLNDNPSRAQIATKLLEQLDDWIKEEPLSDWLEEKVESLFDEIPSPECGQNKPITSSISNYNVKIQPPTTQLLLQEFETVFGDVEACHQFYPSGNNSTTLTPPQSPPPSITEQLPINTQLLVTLQPVVEDLDFAYQQPDVDVNEVNESIIKSDSYLGQICGEWNAENVSLLPLASDVASELAAVDEYVRSCAEDLSPTSPLTSSDASCISSEDSVDDPDWSIEASSSSTSHSKSSSRSSSPTHKSNNRNDNKLRNQRLTKNRTKPYSRSTVEDKKVRKKEQNKNAATRYRQKKKQEITEIVSEEQELVDHNDKLHDQVKELKREIGYLKGLMRDLFKAKGLIN